MKLIINNIKKHPIAGFFMYKEAQKYKADSLYWRYSSVTDALTHVMLMEELKKRL